MQAFLLSWHSFSRDLQRSLVPSQAILMIMTSIPGHTSGGSGGPIRVDGRDSGSDCVQIIRLQSVGGWKSQLPDGDSPWGCMSGLWLWLWLNLLSRRAGRPHMLNPHRWARGRGALCLIHEATAYPSLHALALTT